ncbi:uncharacterized protein LOC124542619 [Vanessa cardui]|uniref:uncharacterized protein LOC124542619 n=1 Tax=Vanessa cardui TaxID=171605 RepID=UPI001F13F917|nr:uncharacterized protein LOC124542619 [Vanessa cardui]
MTTDGKKDGAEQIAESCRVGVRVPPFYPEKPALWFAQLEGQFVLANITSDTTKFYYAIAQLEPQYAAEVEDIITTPPNTGRYDKLKELGDRKPSHFVRHLQNLAGPGVPEEFLRTIWTSRLPQSTQSIIASQPRASLEELADLADRIHDVVTPNFQVASASSPAPPESSVDAMTRQISELTRQVAELTTRVSRMSRPRQRDRSRSRRRQYSSSSKSQCWYHIKFGEKAKRCIKPCEFSVNSTGGR